MSVVLLTPFFVLHWCFWQICCLRHHDGVLLMDAEDKDSKFLRNCWIDGGEEKSPDKFIVLVCVIMLPWKQSPHFSRNSPYQLTDNYGVKNTKYCVNCLLLFHKILYIVTLTVKSCVIMHLFHFLFTSLPGGLPVCETLFMRSLRPSLRYHSRGRKSEN